LAGVSLLGTSRQRQKAQPPERADALAGVVVRDLDDHELRVGELWQDQPAALVFLRHYGCTHCRAHAVELHRARDDFAAAGVRLAVIGHGRPEHARDFQRAQKVEGLELYVDSGRDAYRAAGTKVATLGELFNPGSVAQAAKNLASDRIVQGLVKGHAAQLGGVLIVKPDGTVPFAHLAEDAADNAPAGEVVEAARAAAGDR